jgi:hypothetical protein
MRTVHELADLLLLVVDRSEPATAEDDELLALTAGRPRIVVVNKADLPAAIDVAARPTWVCVSATTRAGLVGLRRAIVRELTGAEPLRDTAAISNARHIALVEQARGHLMAAQRAAARGDTPEEFVLADLQAARARLDEIVGARTSEDVLQHILAFCPLRAIVDVALTSKRLLTLLEARVVRDVCLTRFGPRAPPKRDDETWLAYLKRNPFRAPPRRTCAASRRRDAQWARAWWRSA